MERPVSGRSILVRNMQNFTKIVLGVFVVALCLAGCGPSDAGPSTAEEKKAFGGGPMPENVRKQFEESQKLAAQRAAQAREDAIKKAGQTNGGG